jgi:Bacterial Ig domain/Chitobiase/beta-hexosaminidase C-terminal domain/CARDB
MSFALASLTLTAAAAASAALPTSAAARPASSAKAEVGQVTVVTDTVKLRGRIISGTVDLSAGSRLVTDKPGHAQLKLNTKKTRCDVWGKVRMTVKPGGGVIWTGTDGSLSCGTSPASKQQGRFKGKHGLEISSKDPVFELVNRPGKSIVKVTRGFVVVRGLHGSQTAVIVSRNQQVVVPTGGDPGSPTKIQLSARERATMTRLAAYFKQSSDRRPPNAKILNGPPDATTSTEATFAFAADERGASFSCELDGGGFHPCSSPQTYDGLAEGSHTFAVQAVDAAGNLGPASTRTWLVDTTSPSSSITCNGAACAGGWYAKPVSVVLSATDSGSGVAGIRYTLDGSEPSTSNGRDYQGPLVVQSATQLRYRAYDKAGNAEAPHQQALDIDPVPPTVALVSPGPGATVPADVTLTASAADNVAVDRVEFLVDGTLVGTAKSAPYTVQHAFGPGEDGPHTMVARAVDSAGNAAQSSETFYVVLPNLTVSVDGSSIGQSCSDTNVVECSVSATFTIANVPSEWGSITAGPFDVLMQASSGVSKTLPVDGLAGGSSLTFTNEELPAGDNCFANSSCTVTVTVDSAHVIAESREDDNVDQETAYVYGTLDGPPPPPRH